MFKNINWKPVGLTSAFLAAAVMLAPAGDTVSVAPKAAPGIDRNPLSFWDGRLTFDFEERLRWEIRDNNFDFDSSVNALTDDNWFEQRARLGLQIKLTNWLKFYGQAQDSREINSDRPDSPGVMGAEGDDTVDLRQGWVELGDAKEFPLTLKLGRQILSYGDERLVGSFDWNNIGRTFDAVKLRWEEKLWWVDLFTSSVVVPERGSYNQSDVFNGNETDRGQIFSGVYFETVALPFQATDFYIFHLHENDSARYLTNPLGDTNFFTFGTRWKSQPGAFAPSRTTKSKDEDGKAAPDLEGPKPIGLDYTGEFAWQSGDVQGKDLLAFAGHADLGYTFDANWVPRIALGYSFASGDYNPNDKNVETFQNLFPTNHKFYGQMDLFSWQNLHDVEVDLKIAPIRAVTMRLDFHAFWLADTNDAWYRANGTTAVRPLSSAARTAGNFVGTELDFLVTWNVSKNLQLEGGYSHFFSGDYLAATGPNDSADFAYLQTKISF
jgi:hypothetical protein